MRTTIIFAFSRSTPIALSSSGTVVKLFFSLDLFLTPHPPYASSSDDMSIKLWDWEKDFECTQVFEGAILKFAQDFINDFVIPFFFLQSGHSHYVMMIRINPRDTNTFASASLDKSIKVWSVSTPTPHFSLGTYIFSCTHLKHSLSAPSLSMVPYCRGSWWPRQRRELHRLLPRR